ncbi:hypothetical protein P3T76_011217 [Phytophthora citrophthora]|uniref:Acyltransferase 3 domain-containing protein n=1 Tax=Phytophthora citrophthora TaxID=4793 RepID=A0AAD9G9Z4_9STRA|nr:hypothetical protein P3T76_011217 [Phytophthora citrophthora]
MCCGCLFCSFVIPINDASNEKEHWSIDSRRELSRVDVHSGRLRFFRVYPLFALVSTVLWILPDDAKQRYYLIDQPENFDLYKVLTFDQRYFVLWTLPLEIGYYFFIPFFVLVVLKLHNFWWVPFVPAYIWVGREGWNEFRCDHMPLSPHFPTFLAGSMAAVIFVKLEAWINVNGYKVKGCCLFGVRIVEFAALSLVLSLIFRGFLFSWVHENIAPQTTGSSFISVLLTVVLVPEMLFPSPLSNTLEWNVLRYCGKVSFSIYLLHGFVIYAESITSQQGYYDRMVSRFGLTLVLATVSYHLVEYPSQLMAQYLSRQLTQLEARASSRGSTGAVSSSP